jgi:hypothetical protein
MATRIEEGGVSAHPYAAFEDSPTWELIGRGLAALEANGDVVVATSHAHIVGYLCEQLAALGRTPPATLAAWRVLRAAGWPLDPSPGDLLGVASHVAGIASAGDERHVALFLRDLPAPPGHEASNDPETFLPLARRLVAACESADGDW